VSTTIEKKIDSAPQVNHRARRSVPPHRLLRLCVAVGLATGALATQAQTVPNIGDALRQSQPPPVPAPQAPALPAIGGAALEPPLLQLPGGGATVHVARYAIVGNRVIDTPTLQAAVTADRDKDLTLTQIEAVATKLTRLYRAAGYFVARAYVPQQQVDGGVVTLRVVEGNYGRFVLSNHSRVNDRTVQALLDDIKDRDIVSLDTLERAMLNINDTPGVEVTRADVMPGEKTGTSDFAVATEPTPSTDGFVMLDNYGSRYTGKDRVSFNFDWNSPTGSGDRLNLSGLTTNDTGLSSGRIGYSGLLAANGTRGEIALSQTHYALGGIYSALNAVGSARSVELEGTTPLKRTRENSLEGDLGFAYRDLVDDVRTTDTRTAKTSVSVHAGLTARVDNRLLGFDGQSVSNATIEAGYLTFHDPIAQTLDAEGADTQGRYSKIDAYTTRASLLPADLTLTTGIHGQLVLGNKSLDGSEKMSVSGVSGVAAFLSNELTGDDALLGHIDLAHPLPISGAIQCSASTFTDFGMAHQDSETGVATHRQLSDIGVGLTAAGKGALAKFQIAHAMSGGPAQSEPTPNYKILVQVGWIF